MSGGGLNMRKFIVVSDLHLVPGGQLQGVDTYDRLRKVVSHINQNHPDAAFCVLDGDLADHGTLEAYRYLAAEIAKLDVPVHFTMGNHDDRSLFGQVFSRIPDPLTGCYDQAIEFGDFVVVLLDSLETGETAGRLSDLQFEWLEARLAEASNRPVIIVLHHSIADLGVPTDFINLQDKERFADVLASHGGVRQVISGHVHMSTAGVYRGIPFTTISGSHYKIYPRLHGPLDSVPRIQGPAQIGVVLAGSDTVVVHHENFEDANAVLSPELFYWDRDREKP